MINIIITFTLLLVGCSKTLSPDAIEIKYAPSPSKFIEINGTRIHYRDEGSGPTIVLMHGVLASLHTWDDWTINLKKDYRVFRFDVPAFGLTGKMGNDQYEIQNYMAIIDSLLKKLSIPNKIILVGNSLGGLLAWNYALLHPLNVDKLVLIDAGAYPQSLPIILRLMILPIIRNIPASWFPKYIVQKNVESVYGDKEKLKEETIQLYFDVNSYPGSHEASIKLFQYLDSISHTTPVQIHNLKMPVLVMWGERDTWVPFNEAWRRDLPKAKIIIYPKVGHIPMEEIPEQSVSDLRNWLKN